MTNQATPAGAETSSLELSIKTGTRLESAVRNGHDIRIAECSHTTSGAVWLAADEDGIAGIVAADSFEKAYEAVIDAMPTIKADEVYEAYGMGSPEELAARVADEDHPDLEEGYVHQSNCEGTGIVSVGHCLMLRRMTRRDAYDMGLQIRSW